MAFRFRLQKVLDHRARLEDEAKRDFLAAQANTNLAKQVLDQMYVAIDQTRARGHELVTGGPDPRMTPTLQHHDHFINGQKIRIEQQRTKIRELKTIEEELQDLLARAAQEKKTLEKLREKHLQEYRAERARKEQEEADDLAVMRYGRGEGP